ncbi:ammonium transporter [Roseibium marinum]|uniref:Amt family ammonium transporter n=1 Tax=Roseibium marinum TaxID=281252 RepID=A0A2S3UMW9_9HYPH|nr:ammonium transporter [Roseibium marinum]POF29031.1 Amt family ammonium transporter [Roseibium marinum]
MMMRSVIAGTVFGVAGLLAGTVQATEYVHAVSVQKNLDMVWVLFAAGLVLLMQVGFMLLEAGLVRSKNSINVAQKNLLDLAVSVLIFAFFGFSFAFGAGGNWFAGFDTRLFGLSGLDPWELTVFAFQVMFCGTAATIISGAVAERMRLSAYIGCSVLTAGLIYPVFAHWAWGTALYSDAVAILGNAGFVDFAGSTVVHGTGAWIALAACTLLGPRIGRFSKDGKPVRIQGHSAVLATSGALILFVGWLGFNGGSTLAASWDVPGILANTVLAAAAGTAVGYFLGRRKDKFILPENSISGLLGGLVAITAGCHILTPAGAMIVGGLGGAVAILGAVFLERTLKIDDPVGAISVHGFSGVVGTLALALLAPVELLPLGARLPQLAIQLGGVIACFVWCFGAGWLLLSGLNRLQPMRLDAASEDLGLNEAEHGTRLGIGHVEDALDRLIAGKADLSMRLDISKGDDSERLTRLFNALMDTVQNEEQAQNRVADAQRTREEAERLSALANATFDAIVISVDGRILDGNKTFEELIGYGIDELEMRGLYEFVDNELAGTLEEHLIRAEKEPREVTLINRDGGRVPVEIRTRVISYRGIPTRVSALVDLRERKKAEAQILHLAQHDPLTDLPNRAVFNAELKQVMEKCARSGHTAALLLVDLDRFKDINDLHGHPVGDTVIRITADRLRKYCRSCDTVSRLGGDEFAIIQNRVQFTNQAEDMALRLVQALSEPVDCGLGLVLKPTASIGVALLKGGDDADQVISNADIALYNAKNRGRNTYCLFLSGMGDEVRQRRALEKDLSAALSEDQFELYFQPRMNLSTCRIESYEALIRWHHPEQGLINPAEFIPVAEASGQIVAIGKYVLAEALRVASTTILSSNISLNVSPVQFRDRDFVDDVQRAIANSGIPAERIELEITETTLIEDDARALAILTRLKEIGVKIALDDFGVGYSSLSYLSRFPFDCIKIDRSFVHEARRNYGSLAIIETVVRLGKALNMRVVAEGVEDTEKLLLLAQRGCHEVQGFLIGRPAPVNRLVREIPVEVQEALDTQKFGGLQIFEAETPKDLAS